MRGVDVLGRYGGEEFLLVLPGCALDQALRVSERVRRVVAADPIVVGDISVLATLSAGVAGSGPGCDSPERLIQAADEALYEAKAGGRNRSEMWIPPFAGATA
jgi:diguanylate cyclase (GGDEF)-like protein